MGQEDRRDSGREYRADAAVMGSSAIDMIYDITR